MSKNKKQHHQKKNTNFFQQQKAFGDWTNLLDPPITLAEVITKVTITPNAPDGFVGQLTEYKLTAQVFAKNR